MKVGLLITCFFDALLLACSNATAASSIVRALQDNDASGKDPCFLEGFTLGVCAGNAGGQKCASCIEILKSAENLRCDSIAGLFCDKIKACADEKCAAKAQVVMKNSEGESSGGCQDEWDATLSCILKESGCSGNECSSEFKVASVTSSATFNSRRDSRRID